VVVSDRWVALELKESHQRVSVVDQTLQTEQVVVVTTSAVTVSVVLLSELLT